RVDGFQVREPEWPLPATSRPSLFRACGPSFLDAAAGVVALAAGLRGFDAQDEPVVGAVEVAGAADGCDANPFGVGDTDEGFEVVWLTDQAVSVVDEDRIDLSSIDGLEHPVPCWAFPGSLPRGPGVVLVDVLVADGPAEARGKSSAVSLLAFDFFEAAVRGVAQTAVDSGSGGWGDHAEKYRWPLDI